MRRSYSSCARCAMSGSSSAAASFKVLRTRATSRAVCADATTARNARMRSARSIELAIASVACSIPTAAGTAGCIASATGGSTAGAGAEADATAEGRSTARASTARAATAGAAATDTRLGNDDGVANPGTAGDALAPVGGTAASGAPALRAYIAPVNASAKSATGTMKSRVFNMRGVLPAGCCGLMYRPHCRGRRATAVAIARASDPEVLQRRLLRRDSRRHNKRVRVQGRLTCSIGVRVRWP